MTAVAVEKVKAPRSYWEMETGLQIRVRLMKIIRNDRIKNVGKSETCTVFQITDYLQTHPYIHGVGMTQRHKAYSVSSNLNNCTVDRLPLETARVRCALLKSMLSHAPSLDCTWVSVAPVRNE